VCERANFKHLHGFHTMQMQFRERYDLIINIKQSGSIMQLGVISMQHYSFLWVLVSEGAVRFGGLQLEQACCASAGASTQASYTLINIDIIDISVGL
jgi:hypothetical protein